MVEDGIGRLDWIKDYKGVTKKDCELYAKKLENPDSIPQDFVTKLVASIFRQKENHAATFNIGSIHGKSISDFYFATVHKDQNNYCGLVHFSNNEFVEIGRFPIVPKVMCYNDSGLYFALKNKIYNYQDRRLTLSLNADFDIYNINSIDEKLYALGNGFKMYIKDGDNWEECLLPKGYAYNKTAKSSDGILWVSGTKGTIVKLKELEKPEIIKPVDTQKINYRLAHTDRDVYLHCKSGLYIKKSGATFKLIKEGNYKQSAVFKDKLYTISPDLMLSVHQNQIVNKIDIKKLRITQIGATENCLALTLQDQILLCTDNRFILITPDIIVKHIIDLP